MSGRTTLILFTLSLWVGCVWADETEEDKRKIQGTWSLSETATKDKALHKTREDGEEHFRRTFKEDRVTDWTKDSVKEGTYKLDATRSPREIDINWKTSKEFGIYKLEGDTLRIYTQRNAESEKERPADFKPQVKEGQALMVFKRDKEDLRPGKRGPGELPKPENIEPPDEKKSKRPGEGR